uniref:Protein kinase domain-containing protein n=1 Tax=Amphimedon queenslandica TaxID=400682 RepID=A0A1X7UYS4_AMPQE
MAATEMGYLISPYLCNFLSKALVYNIEERATASELLRHPFLQFASPPSSLSKLIQFQEHCLI